MIAAFEILHLERQVALEKLGFTQENKIRMMVLDEEIQGGLVAFKAFNIPT